MPWRSIKRLAKILLDSSRPPERFGPNTAMPASRRRSPTPAAIAVSGPSTTRSMRSHDAAFGDRFAVGRRDVPVFAARAVPALPGAAKIASHDGDCASRHESASSRAPLPTTRMRITLLPLDRGRRLRRDVVGDAVDAGHFVDDARARCARADRAAGAPSRPSSRLRW